MEELLMKTLKLGEVIVSNRVSGENFTAISKAYDAGAFSVLAEMAKTRLMELEVANQVYVSSDSKESSDQLDGVFHEIMRSLEGNDIMRVKMLNYEEKACLWSAMNGESHFIQGYLEGYLFAKRAAGDSLGK